MNNWGDELYYWWVKTCLSYDGEDCFDNNCFTTSYFGGLPEGYNDIFIEDNKLSEIKVYPNPTNGKIYYNFEEDQKI